MWLVQRFAAENEEKQMPWETQKNKVYTRPLIFHMQGQHK